MDTSKSTQTGFSLTTIIALILLVLKLCNVTSLQNFPWWGIIAIWLSPLAIALALIIIGALLYSAGMILEKLSKK